MVETKAFESRLAQEGFTVVNRELAPGEGADDHAHDFEAWGLVTAGAFHITCAGESRRYGPGDEFRVAAGTPHSERAGEAGAAFVVGRRDC